MGTCYLTCKQIPDSKELLTSRNDFPNEKADLTKTVHTKETIITQEHSDNPHYLQANNLNNSEFFGNNNELCDIKDPIMPSNNISAIEPNGNSLYIGLDERNEFIKLCQIEGGNNDTKKKTVRNTKRKKNNIVNSNNNSNKHYKNKQTIKNKNMNAINTNSNKKYMKK